MTDDERHFSPAARYACLGHDPGDRWHDEQTGQEHWRGRVGVDTLLDAGATLEEPGDVRLPYYVKIGPYQPPEPRWVVKITRKALDVREKEGLVDFVSTRSAVASEVFDDREDAVSHACDAVDAFDDAAVRDAREWWEERQQEREDDESTDGDDTTEDEQTEQQTIVTDGGRDAIVGSVRIRCDGGEEPDRYDSGSERFVAPQDALGQRHRFFHEPGCGSIPQMSESVTQRQTRLRALDPCPDCNPKRADPA